jgi:methionine--tRNA ligase beta chain
MEIHIEENTEADKIGKWWDTLSQDNRDDIYHEHCDKYWVDKDWIDLPFVIKVFISKKYSDKNEYLNIKHILRYDSDPDEYSEYKEAKIKYYNMTQKPNISFDTFTSLDIRVCEVLEAERIPKTDKLLKLLINTGIDARECVTNLGELYKPEDFIGKRIPFIINLEPTLIKKITSKAMIFIPDTKVNIFNLCDEFEIGENIFIK